MSERADGETNEELIATAAAHGHTVSKRQLAEWHRAGLLPTPEQVHGDRVGSISLYPVGTAERLLVLCTLRKRSRRDADVGWGLWWAGFDVPEAYVRPPLERWAGGWNQGLQQLRALLGSSPLDDADGADVEEVPDTLLDFLDQWSTKRITPAAVAHARKRVGRERFATLLRILLEVITGTFHGYSVDAVKGTSDDEREIVEAGLGLTRGRTDRLADAEPWLSGDTEEALIALSALVQRYPPGHGLDVASMAELARARDEIKTFVGMLRGWSATAEQMFGRGAFGLTLFRVLGEDERPSDQGMWLLLWRTLRLSNVGAAMDLLLPVAQQWLQQIQPIIVATQQLRIEVPATAVLLDPKQIGRGMRSKRVEEQRLAALRALRETHAEELDAFFAKHPEVKTTEPADTGQDEAVTDVQRHPSAKSPKPHRAKAKKAPSDVHEGEAR